MRFDQIVLASMVGDREVGQFSAALRIAEIWYLIPMCDRHPAFPVIVAPAANKGRQSTSVVVQRLYDLMAWLGVGSTAAVAVLAQNVVPISMAPPMPKLPAPWRSGSGPASWYPCPSCTSRWLLAEGLQHYGLVYTLCGATLNVSLNFWLIPLHGAIGAAWATLVTQTCLMPLQLLFPKARRNLWLMMCTLGAPLKIPVEMSNRGLALRLHTGLAARINRLRLAYFRRVLGAPDVMLYFPFYAHPIDRLQVGQRVAISAFVHIVANGGVSIGDDTIIASAVQIASSTHDYHVIPVSRPTS